MPDKILNTGCVEDVPASELNTRIRAEFTGVANITEVILGRKRRNSFLHSSTFRLKARQARFLTGYTSALVFTMFMYLLARFDFCDRLGLLLLVIEDRAD